MASRLPRLGRRVPSEGMVRRRHGDHGEPADINVFNAGYSGVLRAADADTSDLRLDELCNSAQCLNVKAEQHRRELRLECPDRVNQPRGWHHHIDYQRHLGLEAALQSFDAGAKVIDPARYRAGLRQERRASFSEDGLPRPRSIEQHDAELALEVGDGVADGGGGAAEPAARSRETPTLHHDEQDLELIEGGRSNVWHFNFLERYARNFTAILGDREYVTLSVVTQFPRSAARRVAGRHEATAP